MVWGLIPADSLRGALKYYILAPGTYKVGRKDCDIIVQMDTAVSRLHAEIVVDKMVSPDTSCTEHTKSYSSHVRIRDGSKYGTFVNKELGSKAVRLRHGEEANLKEGDTVTFGSGNASFRFCGFPFRIFIHSPSRGQLRSIQTAAACIGATVALNWSTECTHVLVNESSSVTMEIVEAVVSKKFVVLIRWFEVFAEKNICTELPSCSAFVPTLNLKDIVVKIVDPKTRENCLKGYTFVLGSSHKYKFGDKLQLLLQMIEARYVGADEFLTDSQISADRENNQVVLVIPDDSTSEFSQSREFSFLSRITDIKLLAAILSGDLDSSLIELPSIIISSSHSTDETIVADSDVEMDTAASTGAAFSSMKSEAAKESYGGGDVSKILGGENEHCEKNSAAEEISNWSISLEGEGRTEGDEDAALIRRKYDKANEPPIDRHENSDILYCQGLLVRDAAAPVQSLSSSAEPVNFKRFRKREVVSGNSFRNLIPFSRDPYKEAEYGRHEQSDYTREEKKRVKLEAIAEEMFNTEKMKKRSAVGASLESFLART